jgi:hypothetical protein
VSAVADSGGKDDLGVTGDSGEGGRHGKDVHERWSSVTPSSFRRSQPFSATWPLFSFGWPVAGMVKVAMR